jgi:hypothetical protein
VHEGLPPVLSRQPSRDHAQVDVAVSVRVARASTVGAAIALSLLVAGALTACRRTVRLRNLRAASSNAGEILFSGRRIPFSGLSPGEVRTVVVWGRKSKRTPDGGTCVQIAGDPQETCCSYEDWSGEPKNTSFEVVDGPPEIQSSRLRCEGER